MNFETACKIALPGEWIKPRSLAWKTHDGLYYCQAGDHIQTFRVSNDPEEPVWTIVHSTNMGLPSGDDFEVYSGIKSTEPIDPIDRLHFLENDLEDSLSSMRTEFVGKVQEVVQKVASYPVEVDGDPRKLLESRAEMTARGILDIIDGKDGKGYYLTPKIDGLCLRPVAEEEPPVDGTLATNKAIGADIAGELSRLFEESNQP